MCIPTGSTGQISGEEVKHWVIQSLLKGNPKSTSLWDNYKNQHSWSGLKINLLIAFFLSSAMSLQFCFVTLVLSVSLFLSLSVRPFIFKESKYHLKSWTVGSHCALCRPECILCMLSREPVRTFLWHCRCCCQMRIVFWAWASLLKGGP